MATTNRRANNRSNYAYGYSKSGMSYLKVLLCLAMVDTPALASHVRKQINLLNKYMVVDASHNILKFNKHVSNLMAQLTAQNKTSTDLVTNLFTAYCACTNREFCTYIDAKETQYEEETDFTAKHLMDLAQLPLCLRHYAFCCLYGQRYPV